MITREEVQALITSAHRSGQLHGLWKAQQLLCSYAPHAETEAEKHLIVAMGIALLRMAEEVAA